MDGGISYELSKAKGCLIVINYLYRRGSCGKYQITRGLKLSKDAVDHAIDVLVELGLCRVNEDDEFPFSKNIELTTRGMEFVETPVKDLPSFFFSGLP